MDYYVNQNCGGIEKGTKEHPFSTIQRAALIARPGDTIWIGEGIYREWVNPVEGGYDEDHRITYTSMPGEKVIISGAEIIANWDYLGNDLWKAVISGKLIESYNPYEDEIFGDWYEGLGQTYHTGEVFMDDVALFEAPSLENIKQEDKPEREYSWFAAVTETGTEIWVYMPGKNPNEHKMEASVRPYGIFPEKEGRNYITISGLTVEKVATQWAPPTAFQAGAIGTHWSKGWIIENCTICNSKCSGISVGKRREEKDNIWSRKLSKGGTQTQTEAFFSNLRTGWSKENVGSHLIRNNEIFDCGQAGIFGAMGGVFTEIVNNHIHHINVRNTFGGHEMAGVKLHGGIDVLLKGNLIHDCTRGLWLDWEAQGARVSRNAFFNNRREDFYIEVCHGPCTIDNNLFLSESNVKNLSQGTAFIHNLFAGRIKMDTERNRSTMYHFPHETAIAGHNIIYGGDDRAINNIYLGNNASETEVLPYGRHGRQSYGNIVYDGYSNKMGSHVTTLENGRPMAYADIPLPVYICRNLYFNGAKKYEHEVGAEEEKEFTVKINVVCQGDIYYLETNLAEYEGEMECDLITSPMLGKAFESEAYYENPDGTPITFDVDFNGSKRDRKCVRGPFVKYMHRITISPLR